MSPEITEISVKGLHGLPLNVTIPVEDNRLILVGENGTGKSTVANLFYYTLTQQWRRLAGFSFDSIRLVASGDRLELSHDDIDSIVEHQSARLESRLRHRYPPAIRRRIESLLLQETLPFDVSKSDEDVVAQIARYLGVTKSVARRLVYELRDSDSKLKKSVAATIATLDSLEFGQFLYLPTYRRIEQDLGSIFAGIEVEETLRKFRARFSKRATSAFVELVEFGMEDVDRTINERMAQIKEIVRTGLSAMTGTYLSEVIRGLQHEPDTTILKSVTDSDLEAMFARI